MTHDDPTIRNSALKRHAQRHRQVTNNALAFFGCTILLVFLLSINNNVCAVFDPDSNSSINESSLSQLRRLSHKNNHKHGDYSAYSCDNLGKYTTHHNRTKQCAYAKTCNDGEGILIPSVYCSETYSPRTLGLLWSPLLVLVVLLLFRMVSSTSEDFFTPALEMLSLKMGLPPRFAGVTLLALGNGAPDIAATVNAIRNDKSIGYLMSIGELTGSGMFIGAVISGVIVYVAGDVNCGYALVRDVIMLFLTNSLIYIQFNQNGVITRSSTQIWFGMYLAYVLVVAIADWYHTSYGVPKLNRTGEELELQRQQDEIGNKKENSAITVEAAVIVQEAISPPPPSGERTPLVATATEEHRSKIACTAVEHVFEVMSNYDSNAEAILEKFDWAKTEPDGVEPIIVAPPHRREVVNMPETHRLFSQEQLKLPTTQILEFGQSGEWKIGGTTLWTTVLKENKADLAEHLFEVWNDIYRNEENIFLDKMLLTCELPFTALRKLSVPIPCPGYYCRPLVGISTGLAPFWLRFYFDHQYEISFAAFPIMYYTLVVMSLLIGLLIMRCNPAEGDGCINLWVAVPLGLYGFVLAATWIDLVADILVDVLTFMGVICNIPAAIMGATVLAVGNSVGDLSANITVARKGLCDMAITACFAGPVFNILIGLGLGFTALLNYSEQSAVAVYLTPQLNIGFLFSIANSLLVIGLGICCGRGTLRSEYSYAALVLYVAYLVTSLSV